MSQGIPTASLVCLRCEGERVGRLLDGETVAGRVPQDAKPLVPAVVGAASAGDAEEARPQRGGRDL
jgi:hypothetical protein